MFNPLDKIHKDANRDFFKVPKSVQQAIPIVRIYEDGIFELPNGEFSALYKFSDINYSLASEEEKEYIFDKYCDFVNSIGSDCKCKITIYNRRLNLRELRERICINSTNPDYDRYIAEYNQMISEAAVSKRAFVQEKYITITIKQNDIDDARRMFRKYTDSVSLNLSSVRSNVRMLNDVERLSILHNFYRDDDRNDYEYEDAYQRVMGDTFKDYISPDYIDLSDDSCVRFSDNKYARVLFLKQINGKKVKDDFISAISNLNREIMISIDFETIASETAERFVENVILGVETSITRWQGNQNRQNNFSAVIPPTLKRQQKEARFFLTDLTDNDQMMHEGIITVAVCSRTKEELDKDTEEIKSLGNNCQLATLRWEQLDGLATVLPIGIVKIDKYRTFLTDSLAIFMPFYTNSLMQKNGIFFGQHAQTGNLILIDQKSLNNGNQVILGSSGSGKSFLSKTCMLSYIFSTDADIIVIDPEREYSKMLNQLGGETIFLSPTTQTFINALDINENYADRAEGEDPVTIKAELLVSICEQCMNGMQFTLAHRSVADRCARNVLTPYVESGFRGEVPTLVDFYNELVKQPEKEASQIAISLEIFVKGSFNMFAHPSNVNVDGRITIYDLKALDSTLKPLAMLIMMDNILNRITRNKDQNKNTYIIIDEAWLLFQYKYTAKNVENLYRRVRKYGAFITSITQNLSDMIHNEEAYSMLKNSELVVMLKQDKEDRNSLTKLYSVPSEMLNLYISNAPAGSGIIKCGDQLIPFQNSFPKDTELYHMMSTKVGEEKNIPQVEINSSYIESFD